MPAGAMPTGAMPALALARMMQSVGVSIARMCSRLVGEGHRVCVVGTLAAWPPLASLPGRSTRSLEGLHLQRRETSRAVSARNESALPPAAPLPDVVATAVPPAPPAGASAAQYSCAHTLQACAIFCNDRS